MRSLRTTVTAAVAVILSATTVLGASPSLTVDSVGGQTPKNGAVSQPLSGNVDVRGTATLGGDASESGDGTAAAPLVADAGDSPFVATGDPAALLGMAFGGTLPYTYTWSSPVGTLSGADGATAELDTAGVPAGTYPVSFSVTDANGATASDTVALVVYERVMERLLEETQTDPGPGVVGVGAPEGSLVFDFDVPAATERIDVSVTWTLATNDYDITVHDPTGSEVGSSAGAPPSTQEATGIAGPAPGAGWTIEVLKYATAADQVTATVDATIGTDDPRPSVAAGGPYRFLIGDPQHLDGSIAGGTEPVSAAWDLDGDGVFETSGVDVETSLAPGRHLVTLKATDAAGLERRQTTSVLVADATRLAQDTSAFTVIGIADTGINPYHLEFAATTYPDPDILALTDNFTRHPSEYIPGYPAAAKALDVTLGEGYFPAADAPIWDGNTTISAGELYWIPGTKIIGAIDAGGSTGATSSDDPHPILDDNGHGSGSASVSAGNRYGYCPTCLLVVVEGLDETVATRYDWVDITSHSFGYVGGLPVGLVTGANEVTRDATERGQTVLFAAGNGVGNAFDVPIATYGSDQTGPDWAITVGALRRDNQRAVVGDGIPVHISAWGDGNLPSACRTGTVGQCAFGGTSAATPYTAGVFGTVLTEVRHQLGDPLVGQRDGQVVADGVAIPESEMLADGKLTRAELRAAVLKTAYPLNQENEVSTFPYPLTAPYAGDANVLFEGYGAATPEGARRAIDVILGRELMPDRSFEDEFFALDRAVRDTLYGGYDRDEAVEGPDYQGLAGTSLTPESVASVEGTMAALQLAADHLGAAIEVPTGSNALTYYLHRRFSGDPGEAVTCAAADNEQYMDRSDTSGDLEPCFDSRVTSVVAAYRPVGIFAAADTLDAALPAGSSVTATIYIAGETSTAIRPTGVLMATDREIGTGQGVIQPVLGSGPAGAACATLGEACWTKFVVSFDTTRPAFAGEHLTFQVQLIGARSWAFGHEGAHASRVAIVPAEMPASGLEFGVTIDEPADGSTVVSGSEVIAGGRVAFPDPGSDPTGAGDHPTTRKVEVSLDDPNFGSPVEAAWDEETGLWSAPLGTPAHGEHTVYARAVMDTTRSEVASSSFTVGADARVEWQVVSRNSAPAPDAWQTASGVQSWSYAFNTADHGKGHWTLVTRLVEESLETARATVRARFQ